MSDDLRLVAVERQPARAALFLDFDGTLADIAASPEAAVARPGVAALLAELDRRLGRLTIVSGRPLSFLVTRLDPDLDLVGLYGLEWRSDGESYTLSDAERWRGTVDVLVSEGIERFGPDVVEPKGVSFTVHYRNDPALEPVLEAWADDVATRTGLEARPAKQSFELHPPIERDKGTAVEVLADGFDPVVFIGDDLGDVPAFDALDRLATQGVQTVGVAVASPETPSDLIARADFVVDGPAGVESLLADLIGRLRSALA